VFGEIAIFHRRGPDPSILNDSLSLLNQIISEQDLGYLVLDQAAKILELNDRAKILIDKFSFGSIHPQNQEHPAESIEQLMANCISASGGQNYTIFEDKAKNLLDVSHHVLTGEKSGLHLILLKEICYLPQSIAEQNKAKASKLTPRQKQVLHYLVNTGLSYDEIAFVLSVSSGTLRKHLENIFKGLGVHSRAELMNVYR
jgi:DNA-binding CsgD family transcriptional regulator